MYFPDLFIFLVVFLFLFLFLLHIRRELLFSSKSPTRSWFMLHCYLANPLKFFFYNSQNLFWFSAPFFSEIKINDYNMFLYLKHQLRFFFEVFFELYLTSVVLLFILILFHLDSPQLSDYPCLFILANEKITLETMGSQSALSLRLFRFVYPSGFSLKRENSKYDLSKWGHINKASKKGRNLHQKSSSLVTVKTVFLWNSML